MEDIELIVPWANNGFDEGRVDGGVATNRPPQIRTGAINASGSSTHHVCRSRGREPRRGECVPGE